MRTIWTTLVSAALLLISSVALAVDYRVGAGDRIELHVYGEPDLSRALTIDDSCHITVGLIGRVEVCRHTTTEIEELVASRLAEGFLVHPQVTVEVEEYRSQWIEVDGEVANRGRQWLEGPTTLSEVITAAGGPRAENVVDVTVYGANGEQHRYDLTELLREEPVYMRDGDRIILHPGRLVYVEGEVKKAGPITYKDGLTVTQALAMAGGPGDYANLRRVSVIRASGEKVRVNITKVNQGQMADVTLGPDDRLIIGRGLMTF